MINTSRALNTPKSENPKTLIKSMFQAVKPTTAAIAQAIGKAFFAPQLKTVINTIVTKIGMNAKNAYM
jgi:hypothetical protein